LLIGHRRQLLQGSVKASFLLPQDVGREKAEKQ
jgi:hypothetical protein